MNKLLFILIFVLATMTACGKDEQSVNYGTAALQTHYQAIEEIVFDSHLIVEVELTGKTENIKYKDANFKVTEAQVKKVIKGDQQLISNNIRVLEVAAFSMNEHKKNVLFLEKYVGPITNNAYVVAGVYQGKFKLDKDDKLIYDADQYGGEKSFQSELEGLDLKSVEAIVQHAVKNARPPKSLQKDEGQLKKNEEESLKLLDRDRKSEQK